MTPDPPHDTVPNTSSAQSRLEACYEAMQAGNGRINAVLDVFNDTAIEAMLDADQRLENGGALSAVDGMPVGVKANIGVAGRFFHGGIKAYASRRADDDATAVARLRAAGALIVGTLNMDEAALGATSDNPWFGRTEHPGREGFTPGGSSGGSAAAVAAGFNEAALGTDTMGSLRIPAAYCGVWAFKPSQRADLMEGVMPLSPALDTLGVIAKSLDAAADVMAALLDRDLSGQKAGAVYRLDWDAQVDCDPLVQSVYDAFVDGLPDMPATGLGSYAYARSRRAAFRLCEADAYHEYSDRLAKAPGGFSDALRALLEFGRDLPDDRIAADRAHLAALRADASLPDFILMPTAPQTAFAFDADVPENQADFTAFANLADRPAIQFPIGLAENGLPVGAQLVGPRGGEAALLATVRALLS